MAIVSFYSLQYSWRGEERRGGERRGEEGRRGERRGGEGKRGKGRGRMLRNI